MKQAIYWCFCVLGCASAAPERSVLARAPALQPTAVTSPSELPTTAAPSTPAPAPTVPNWAPPTGAVWPPPGGFTPPPCELESTAVVRRAGKRFEVHARLRNVTKAQLEIDTPNRCPNGAAIFSGLPEGYDYYGACAAGACVAPSKSVHLSLAPGQSSEVVSIEIDPQRASCNAALAPGKYQLGFSMQTSHRVCGGNPPGVIDIPETKPAAPLPRFVPEAGPSCPAGHTCG